MQIDQTDPIKAIVTLETEAGYYAFKAGIEDRRNWVRSPETIELSAFCRDNHKSAQIVVGYKDNYTRIK
jgi:hypothetical protein